MADILTKSHIPTAKANLFLYISSFPQKREEFADILKFMIFAFRDILVFKSAKTLPSMFFSDETLLEEYASHFREDSLMCLIEELEKLRLSIYENANMSTLASSVSSTLWKYNS